MKVETGAIVSVHYKGTLTENGEEFDSSEGREPLTFMVGMGQMIPGFEEELMGAEKGEKRTFNLEPERAYGQHDPAGIQKVPKSQFPPEIEVGMVLAAELENGVQMPLKVVEIGEEEVTIDFNHMLAGKTLTFEVEVIELRDAEKEEVEHGHAHGPEGHSDEQEPNSDKSCADDGCC
tara:strand:+ start:4237 stop:4767 length:531 start_codon:yes stop_codon:yes gene_type:complete